MKLLIVDDHPLVVEGLHVVLQHTDLEIVASASCIEDACTKVVEVKPEMILVDLRLGQECGLDFIERARQTGYEGKLVIFSSDANRACFDSIQNGLVDGYVLKDAFPDELVYALKVIGRGRKFYDPKVMENMLQPVEKNENIPEDMTPREVEILGQLAKGLNNKAIAEKLYISEYTVKKHVSRILGKLELQDRTQAALYAYKRNLTAV